MHAAFEKRKSGVDYYFSYNLSYFRHIHPHVELVFVFDGELQMMVENRQTLLRAGDMAVVFPNTVHSYVTDESSRSYFVIFSPELVGEYSRILSSSRPSDPFLIRPKVHRDIAYILERLQDEEQIKKRILQGYLAVLTGRLLDNLKL